MEKKITFEEIEDHLIEKHNKNPPNDTWAWNYALKYDGICDFCTQYIKQHSP